MSEALAQVAALSAAFWTALLLALRDPGARCRGARVALGLGLGAALAHLGWAALHGLAAPALWLDPTRGFCVLFVPFGPLLVAPRPRAERHAFLGAALGALPLAFAVARLGCVAAGCCGGAASEGPWSIRGADGVARHPAALYEAAACTALQLALRGVPPRMRAPAALAGLGLARIALAPLRAPPPLGEPAVDPRVLAALLVAAGAALARPPRARERWRRAPLFR